MQRPKGKGAGQPCACGDHYWAPTTKHGVTLVSPEDAEWLLKRNWSMLPGGYAMTNMGGKTTYLHRLILGADITDHKNRWKLDNRRENLRACTQSQNLANRRYASASGLRGVKKHRNKWVARLRAGGAERHLGSFETREEAAAAYNAAAGAAYGEFATLNSVGGAHV